MYIVTAYRLYLAISLALTVWVARTLERNGRVFLVEAFQGNAELADSVNRLLVVGFYLINVGYVTLALSTSSDPGSTRAAMELLSDKIGVVLLVLGLMHFFNLYVFHRLRKRGQERSDRRVQGEALGVRRARRWARCSNNERQERGDARAHPRCGHGTVPAAGLRRDHHARDRRRSGRGDRRRILLLRLERRHRPSLLRPVAAGSGAVDRTGAGGWEASERAAGRAAGGEVAVISSRTGASWERWRRMPIPRIPFRPSARGRERSGKGTWLRSYVFSKPAARRRRAIWSRTCLGFYGCTRWA